MSSLSFSSLLQASEKKNILDDLVGHGDGGQLAATALPQGTVRKHFKGYEEVIVPPTPTAPLKPGERLVLIHTRTYFDRRSITFFTSGLYIF